MKYWQQSGGDGDRNYVEACIKFGVILNGPGYSGFLDERSINVLRADEISEKKISDLVRFRDSMENGDVVVLRVGTKDIYAVGVISGPYEWNNIFSDVDGWDLQHVRRVKWLLKADDFNVIKSFPVWTLKQGDTTQELTSQPVIDWIDSLHLHFDEIATLPTLPECSEQVVEVEEISDFMFEKGVSGNTIKDLVETIADLHMIAKWYKKAKDPSEFETEAYLIIPLLRALGWTPQKMALEYNDQNNQERQKIDIALFSKLPRTADNLRGIVEAKKKGYPCLTAFDQANQYALSYALCNRLIVSDGLRYGVFIKQNNVFTLYAYMNLTELKDKYQIHGCYGIKEALWSMTAEWVDR